jgi:hypothetical protein
MNAVDLIMSTVLQNFILLVAEISFRGPAAKPMIHE